MFRLVMIFIVSFVASLSAETLRTLQVPQTISSFPQFGIIQKVAQFGAAQRSETPAGETYPCVPVGDAQRFKTTLALHGAYTSEIRDPEQIGDIVNRIHALGGLTPKPENIERLLVFIGKRNALFAYVQNNEICTANLGAAKPSLLLLYSVIGASA
jgi:hypothetical protein